MVLLHVTLVLDEAEILPLKDCSVLMNSSQLKTHLQFSAVNQLTEPRASVRSNGSALFDLASSSSKGCTYLI